MDFEKTNRNWTINFSEPKGEAGLLGPESVSWRVWKNPIVLNIGSIAAVLYQFAEPRVRDGVWENTVFETDPIGRGRRTAAAALAGVFAPASEARRIIEFITRMHGKVQGHTDKGVPYRALDSDLLDWVGATGVYLSLKAYEQFVAPVSAEEELEYFAEQAKIIEIYRSKNPILSVKDFEQMMYSLAPTFESSEIVNKYLSLISTVSPGRGVPQAVQQTMVKAAVSLLHPIIHESLELGTTYELTDSEREMIASIGYQRESEPDTHGIPAQASVRMGLPADFLWQTPSRQQELLKGLASYDRNASGVAE